MSNQPRKRRRYSDAEQAEALAALDINAGNIGETSRVTGIPEQTLREWKAGTFRPAPPELRAQKREELTRGLEKLARRILRKVLKVAGDPNTKVSLRDGTVALGIVVDKLFGPANTAAATTNVTVNVNPPSLTLTPADIEAAKQLLAGVRTLSAPPARGSVVEMPTDPPPDPV